MTKYGELLHLFFNFEVLSLSTNFLKEIDLYFKFDLDINRI